MQERQLRESSLQNNEHRIHEIQNFGDVEDVEDESDGRVGLVEVTSNNRVTELVSLHESLNAHVGAQHDLNHVVSEFDSVQTRHGFGFLHHGLQEREERWLHDFTVGRACSL
jgi:hypothetical protein